MNEQKIVIMFITTSLLLLTALVAIVPGAEAQEEEDEGHEGDFDNLGIQNNDHWKDHIAFNDSQDKFEISVSELNGKRIDVYILRSDEYDKYEAGEDFYASYSQEDIAFTGEINWTCPDDSNYYLVVDNEDNAHTDDAYANESVSVDVSWLNKTEEKEIEEFLDFLKWFGVGITVLCCVLPVLVIIVVIYIFVIRSDKSQPPTIYPPMGQTPLPPHSQPYPPQGPTQAPPYQPYPPQGPPQAPSQPYPPQAPPIPSYPPQDPPQTPSGESFPPMQNPPIEPPPIPKPPRDPFQEEGEY